VKYCLILKKQQSLPTSYVGATETKPKKREVTNVFMLLESDSEAEEEVEAEAEEDLPTTSSTRVALDYTNIIRITHKQEKERDQVSQVQVQIEAKQIPKPIPQIPRVFGKSRWLDVVSSSDEEDNSDEE
jgi:hypothetical protein